MKLDFDLIKEWYNNPAVKFEMIRYTYNREVAFIVPYWLPEKYQKRSTRMFKIHSVQHLDFHYNISNMFKHKIPYNLYYSLAKYKTGIPNQEFYRYSVRDNKYWNDNNHKHIVEYDFLIDIDVKKSEDIMYAYDTAKSIIDLFDRTNTPYELRYSGMGFHIIIPHKYLPQNKGFIPKSKNSIYKFCQNIALELQKAYSEIIDIKIYDSRRVCKIPYSLSLYENNIYVCVPFKELRHFKKFDINNFTPDIWFRKVKKRGNYIFNNDGNILKLLEYLKLMDSIK